MVAGSLAVPSYDNHVIRLRDVQGRILIGYLYGGIEASGPNDQPSIANDSIFRVYLTPDPVVLSTNDATSTVNTFFPNPAHDVLIVNITEQQTTTIELRNAPGQLVYTSTQSGACTVQIPVGKLAAGIYTLSLKTADASHTYPVTIAH
jgi:hypothetical protein